MAKINPSQYQNLLRKEDDNYDCWLFFGSNEGKVRDFSKQVQLKKSDNNIDKLNTILFNGSDFSDDEHIERFWNEIQTPNMFGGKRTIIIANAKDNICAMLQEYLEEPSSDMTIIMQSGNLDSKSKLRLLCEKSEKVATVACYDDEDNDRRALLIQMLKEYNLSIDPKAESYIHTKLSKDRVINKMEIEKLCLYQGSGKIELQTAMDILGDSKEDSVFDVIISVASGDITSLSRKFNHMWQEKINPVALLRICNTHFNKLLRLSQNVQMGQSIVEAVKDRKEQIFWKNQNSFIDQLSFWEISNIISVLKLLADTEKEVMKSHRISEIQIEFTLIKIASMAKKLKKQKRL